MTDHALLPSMPERIGRYELLLPIAMGGMATVYLARTLGTAGFERDVAVKVAHPQFSHDPEFAQDLVEEAKLAVRVRHPNVVSILDVGEDIVGLFLVMDYIEGDSLSGLLRRAAAAREPVPIGLGLRILVDALAGLHAAHELRDEGGQLLGLVHRDFSPQNILVGLDGMVRLADFGIAKAASRRGHTRTGDIKGKIAYLAPEQARSERVDRRADLWAAGVVAWEIIAGQPLYRNSDDLGILLKIISEDPPRLSSVRPGVPEAFDDVVHLALVRNRDHRCDSAVELSRAIVEACSVSGVEMPQGADVAALVERVSGSKLRERRARAKDVIALRTKIAASLAEPASSRGIMPSAPALPTIGPVAAGPSTPAEPEAPTQITNTTATLGVRRERARRAAIAVAALVVLLPAAFFLRRRPGGDGPAAASATASAAAPPPLPAPSETATPVTTGGTSTPPAPATASAGDRASVDLSVSANAPIAALQIGERVIPVVRPTKHFSISLTRSEAEAASRLEAVSVDGRHAGALVEPGSAKVSLRFPTVAAVSTPASPTGRALAPSPYDKRP